MRDIYKSILKLSLLLLFISYMAGITLFTHSHIVNGVTIVHSHPFKKGVEHTHTEDGFILIDILNHVLIPLQKVFFSLSAVVLALIAIISIQPRLCRLLSSWRRHSVPRAPPACVFIS